MLKGKEAFSYFIYSTNVVGSNKAASYILALDWLSKMLEMEPLGFDDCVNIWEVDSVDRLQELYLLVLEESRKGEASVWNVHSIPKSYLQKGYCSAAIKSYQSFLVENSYELDLLRLFDEHKGDENEIVKALDKTIIYPKNLLEGLGEKQGQDVVRSVLVRVNQNVFRKMILKIYNQSCCVTGLNIPEINRASHIIPWAEDDSKRLDPRNGLCLSATYDAAFDRNLISLDDEYRIIVSKNIKEYGTKKCVKEYFSDKEGMKITLPATYKPSKEYLAVHRNNGEF